MLSALLFYVQSMFYVVKKPKSAQGWALLAPLDNTCGAVMVRSSTPGRFVFTSWHRNYDIRCIQITVDGERWRCTSTK